ncbi:hypothetical protein PYCC9005_000882 [Savitreella phatthalungensis]
MTAEYDVLIVGAGISGINAAYRLQERLPGCKYIIVEARDVLGGTWALFKYPGIRSDSDLFTFGFAWRPWEGSTRFASGEQIVTYLRESAEEHGIDEHIRYGEKVERLDFATSAAAWTVKTQKSTYRARFVILGTGYYDYDKPMDAVIPGIERFKGQVIHPQFWPENLDYKNKSVCIIGSGATAVTLLPNMAQEAKHVTMLQRSPGYVLTLPNAKTKLPWFFPKFVQFGFDYLRYLILPFIFFKFCRTFPNAARKVIRGETLKHLPASVPHDPHFVPSYGPWEQRLCMSPDGDFFEALRNGKADVATGKILEVTESSVKLESGQTIDADIIVTATGLRIQIAGGAAIYVDGQRQNVPDKYVWRGLMLSDIPNHALVVGYTNASWTLGADCTAIVVTRLIRELEQRGQRICVAKIDESQKLDSVNVFNLNSTYVQKGASVLPKATRSGPFQARSNYFSDYRHAQRGDITSGMRFL